MALKMNVSRWATPMAAVALLAGLGLGAARAGDAPTTSPAGKAVLTVKVMDDAGKPASGVRVSLFPPAGKVAPMSARGTAVTPLSADPVPTPPPVDGGTKPKKSRPKPLQTATTDADGVAAFKDVANGSYTVRANVKGGARGMASVTVADGKDATVEITIKAP